MSTMRSLKKDDVLVVYFIDAKVLDEAVIQEIGDELLQFSSEADHKRLLLNFSGVALMSSAMIGKLVLLNKKCQQEGVELKFCEISPDVMKVFRIMRLNKVFDIYSSEEKALKAFEKRGWFS